MSRCRSFNNSIVATSSVASSAVVGSSAISRAGSIISAMAIAMRCFMPPENSCGNCASRLSGSGMRTLRSMATERASLSRLDRPERYWMSRIWRPTESTGLSAPIGSWNTVAMRWPRSARMLSASSRARSLPPSKTISPEVISPLSASRPRTALMSVDFPQPDSPTTPTLRLAGTVKLTCFNASSRPPSVWKSTLRFRTSRTVMSASSAAGRRGRAAFRRGR